MCLVASGTMRRSSLGILSGPGVLPLERVERRVWKVVGSAMVVNMSIGVEGFVLVCKFCILSTASAAAHGGGASSAGGGAASRVE